jgi:polyhydroxybutyrate depolymerase
MLSFHGTADPIDPYDGNGQPYWTYSVPDALRDWATQDECRGPPVTTHPDPGVTLTRYGHCPGKAVVELYTIRGEGHEWPGGPPLPGRLTKVLGPQSNVIDADAVMWSFFSAHPLR